MRKQDYDFERILLKSSEVISLIDQAITNKKGFSVARFGIGEISYLGSSINGLLVEDFRKRYEKYAGVSSPVGKIRSELIGALKSANLVGVIPSYRLDFWSNQTKKVFKHIQFMPPAMCCAWFMQDFIEEERFWSWLRPKKVFLVGRRANEAKEIFCKQGVQVVGTIGLNNETELDLVQTALLKDNNWEMALVSAGIPATILAPRLAQASQKVVIDFGHALDILIDGDHFDHSKLVRKWNDQHEQP